MVLAPFGGPGLAATPGRAPSGARSFEALVASSAFFTATSPHGGLRCWEPGDSDPLGSLPLGASGRCVQAKEGNVLEGELKQNFSQLHLFSYLGPHVGFRTGRVAQR